MAAESFPVSPPLARGKPRFVMSRKILLDALTRLSRVADTSANPRVPMCSYVHVDTRENGTTLRATDVTTHYSISVPAFAACEGELCLPVRAVNAWLKRTKSRAIDVTHDGVPRHPSITLRADGRRITFESLDPLDYASKPDGMAHGDRMAVLQCGEFARAIASVLPAMSVDETRPHLAGVCISSDDSGIRVVTTDGHRLFMARLDGRSEREGSITFPADAIRAIMAACLAAPENAPCELFGKGTRVGAVIRGDTISSRYVGAFPAWRSVVPQSFDMERAIDPRAILDELRCAAIVSSDRAAGVRIRIGADWITLRTEHPDVGSAEMVLCDDGALDRARSETALKAFGVNTRYLQAALRACGDAPTALCLSGELDPVLIRAGAFEALIMPTRR